MAKHKKDKHPFIKKIPFVSQFWKTTTDESPQPGSKQALKSSSSSSQSTAPTVADTTPASAHNFLRAVETENAPTRSSGLIAAVNVVGQHPLSATDKVSSFDAGQLQLKSPEIPDDGTKPAADSPTNLSSYYQQYVSTISETSTFTWVTSDNNNLSHVKQIGAGGAGEVHEVVPPIINTANMQISDKNDPRVSTLELLATSP